MSVSHTEMVSKNRIPNGDMTGDAFVEATVSEDAEGGGKMLFPVEALVIEVIKFRV